MYPADNLCYVKKKATSNHNPITTEFSGAIAKKDHERVHAVVL